MEFITEVQGTSYHISLLRDQTFFVRGEKAEYILYKNGVWKCAADDIDPLLVKKIGKEIEERVDGEL